MSKETQHDLSMGLIQDVLDESFVDAADKLHTLLSTEVTKQLNELKESVAAELYQVKKITESLGKDATAEDWIKDFQESDDPRFEGKSADKRKEMALAAYNAKQAE